MVKVLVAEDDLLLRVLLVGILFRAGYDVIEAENGGVALEKARRERPDLVLLDVWMPVMDGFEVLRRLRDTPATEAMPVVLLTGMPALEGEAEAMRLGVSHYITKPWRPAFVEATVRVALREAGSLTEEEDTLAPARQDTTPASAGPGPPGPRRIIDTAGRLAPLEQALGGGLAFRSLTLIEGAPSTGKSVLCQHLTCGALLADYSAAYFTSAHTAQGLAAQMDSIALHGSHYLQAGNLAVYPLDSWVASDASGPPLLSLARGMESLPRKYRLVVVDAVTGLAASGQDWAVLSFLSSCKRLCNEGAAVILAADPDALDPSTFSLLRSMCDTHLRLRIHSLRARSLNTLEVRKVNGATPDPEATATENLISFRVEPDIGIRIFPVSRLRT